VWDQEEEQAEEADGELLVRVFGAWRNLAKDSLAQKDAMEKGLAVSMMTVELDADRPLTPLYLCQAMAAQDYMSTSLDLDMFVKRVVIDYWKRVRLLEQAECVST
jgi:hypothetical protein